MGTLLLVFGKSGTLKWRPAVMPLNHLQVITVTVNPTPKHPGSELLNLTCYFLNTGYVYPLCVQLWYQHFSGW